MGTTSEELKKLYKKLGGKDPKVAGFSAPGEILNAINEVPLPTEYELPTVTTEDAGDVLVVNEEGKWDKGEAGGGLPEVTTDDNGDILQVVEGAWTKAAMSKDVEVLTVTNLGDIGMTRNNLRTLCTSKMVIIRTNINYDVEYYLYCGIIPLNLAGSNRNCIVFLKMDIAGNSTNLINKQLGVTWLYGDIDYGRNSKSLTRQQTFVPVLPQIDSSIIGKVLMAKQNGWFAEDPPSSLPEVTAADNGDVLTVVDGAWAKAKPETVVIEGIKYNGAAKLDMTQKEVADLVFAGQDVVLKLHPETDPNSFYYLRLVDVTDKIHFYNITRSQQATNYLWVDVSPTSTSDRATLNSMTVGD